MLRQTGRISPKFESGNSHRALTKNVSVAGQQRKDYGSLNEDRLITRS